MYLLEMVEDGYRMPRGNERGYNTLEEAVEAAKKYTDDALPYNMVRVLLVVGHAGTGGDGEPYYTPVREGDK